MSSEFLPSLSDSQRLKILYLILVVYAFALAFLFLPIDLFGGLAVTVAVTVAVTWISVLVYDGLRLPVVTDGGRVRRSFLCSAVWLLMLLPCPIAISYIGEAYRHTGPPDFGHRFPLPWAYLMVGRLASAHFWVTVIAWFAVIVLTRGYRRWLAWAVILAVGVYTTIVAIGASMTTTGIYW